MNNSLYDSYGHYQMNDAYLQRGGPTYGKPMEMPQPHGYKQPNRVMPTGYSSSALENDYHRSTTAVVATSSPSGSIFPRSASEAMFDSTSKFRQLPCRTFISVGTCPYRERCVYLHDPRCICKDAKTKTRRKNKEDVVLDALFWPVMPYQMVAGKLDANRQPHVIQSYSVPLPQMDQYRRHDICVYSMWMHFVDFCLATTESLGPTATYRNANELPCYAAPDVAVNAYSEQERLKVFQFLSSRNGRSTNKDELIRATSVTIVPGSFVAIHLQNHPIQTQQQSYSRYNAALAASGAPMQMQNYPGYPVASQQGGAYAAYGAAAASAARRPPMADEPATNPYFMSSEPSLDDMLKSVGSLSLHQEASRSGSQNFVDPLMSLNSFAAGSNSLGASPRDTRAAQSGYDSFTMPKPQSATSENAGFLDDLAFYKANSSFLNAQPPKAPSPVTVATNDPRSPSHDYLQARKNEAAVAALKPATSLSMMMSTPSTGGFDIFREQNQLAVDSDDTVDPWFDHHSQLRGNNVGLKKPSPKQTAATKYDEFSLSGLLDDATDTDSPPLALKGQQAHQSAFNSVSLKDPLNLRSNFLASSAQTSTESTFSLY